MSSPKPGAIRKGASVEPISKHEQHSRPDEPLHRRLSPARLSAGRGEPRGRSGKRLSRRRAPLFAVVVVALSVLASAACGGAGRGDASAADAEAGQDANAQGSTPAAKTTASEGSASEGSEVNGRDKTGARAGEAVARNGAARAGDAEAGGDGARAGEARAGANGAEIAGSSRGDDGGDTGVEEGPREVTLEISGDRGTGFSGACSFGGTQRTLDGRVPERYVFEPQGERLECELRTEGALGIVFTDGAGVHSEQQTAGGRSTVKLTYSNGVISSSTSSSSVSESQTVTSSDRSTSEGSQ